VVIGLKDFKTMPVLNGKIPHKTKTNRRILTLKEIGEWGGVGVSYATIKNLYKKYLLEKNIGCVDWKDAISILDFIEWLILR
jgi:hypothetical protein